MAMQQYSSIKLDYECTAKNGEDITKPKIQPLVVDIASRPRLSEYAYKNVAPINHENILREKPLFYEYLNVEFSGKYSTKVFLGGLPHDAKAELIKAIFEIFGEISTVEWPDNNKHPIFPPNGFAFIVYTNEKSVHHLLNYTKKDEITGALYIWFKSETEHKPIEIRPWRCIDSTFLRKGYHVGKSMDLGEVFIGGIPRSFTAAQLATILEEKLKLNVFSVIIDVDNVHRYPKGTAKVTFNDYSDAVKAININKISLRIGNQLKHMEIKLFKER